MVELTMKSDNSVTEFILNMKDGNLKTESTVEAVKLLKTLVQRQNWKAANELLELVRHEAKCVVRALPMESSVGNVLRRGLKIIREEYGALLRNRQDEILEESLHKIVTSEGIYDDFRTVLPALGSAILDHLNEFELELETSTDNIAQQAPEHIHSNEIIMTLGYSEALSEFFKAAAKNRKFELIVASTEPSYAGHELALSLNKTKIQITVIPDSAVFGIMSRVNKVIISTHTVMANGGLRAVCGSHLIAQAAAHYSVPILVLAPLHQLSPKYLCSPDQPSFNTFLSPEKVLSYSIGDLASRVHVYNPQFDYVPPELVTLFVSNSGGHTPSYIYRHLTELYHPDDYEL